MSDEEIKAFVSLLLVAGGETTDKALSNMFTNLIDHPDQLQAVRDDRPLIDNAFAETLRHSPPGPHDHAPDRRGRRDARRHDPRGPTVHLHARRRPTATTGLADPDRFDIFRDDLDVTSLQRRGQPRRVLPRPALLRRPLLAKTEVEIAANLLLDAMDDISFDGGPPAPVGVFTRAPTTLPLRFTPTS